jgi:transcriptional regulator with PAS, ATPase and Fis domain
MSDSSVLKPSDFVFSTQGKSVLRNEMTLEEMEKKMISDCLIRHNNNVSVIADKLGITRQTLYNKIKKYGL